MAQMIRPPTVAPLPSMMRPMGMGRLKADPGYQFRLAQGQNNLTNLYGAQGGLLSGNALRGLNDYNQQFASNEYDRAYGRYANRNNANYQRATDWNTTNYRRKTDYQAQQLAIAQWMANLGLTATGQRVAAGGNLSQLIGNQAQIPLTVGAQMMGGANAQGNISAANSIAQGNAAGNALGGIGNAAGSLLQQWQLQQLMNQTRPASR